ncbi:protein phosphatase 1H-like [Lampetra planeri]
MLSRVRNAVASMVGGMLPGSADSGGGGGGGGGGGHGTDGAEALPVRFPYSRPEFLNLSADEAECSADHLVRPILIPREGGRKMPWATGYAEVINAGKSPLNEDQAVCEVVFVKRSAEQTALRSAMPWRRESPTMARDGDGDLVMEGVMDDDGITFIYWGMFDGHAGPGAAVMAASLLHHHVAKQLQGIVEVLRSGTGCPPACLNDEAEGRSRRGPTGAAAATAAAGGATRAQSLRAGPAQGSPAPATPSKALPEKEVTQDALVVGAIENAFREMDVQIEREKTKSHVPGGCTALTVMFMLGKLYVANAGDSRAIIIRGGEIISISSEFTPETERQRLQFLAHLQPHLLGDEFTALEFSRRVQKKDVGKRMLYRDHSMAGWAYKTIDEDDLKFPLIYGEGKKARVLATIGVTRGLGDHDLRVYDSNQHIKPFLSCSPEVCVYEMSQRSHTPNDVLVMATDGLWDVLSNETVSDAVLGFLANCDPADANRYTLASQELVMKARGVLREKGWRITNEKLGSGDDITVFIIPLHHGNNRSA